MIPLSDNINRALERLERVYFSDAGRTVELEPGELLIGQGQRTRRMYRIMEGSMISYREEDNEASAKEIAVAICLNLTESRTLRLKVGHAGPG